MKKIALFIIFIAIALSYSCKKEGKTVSTSIQGTLIVNGTNDPIKISKELRKPEVVLYHRHGGGVLSGGGPQWDEVARAKVDMLSKFSMELELLQGEEYFMGYYYCDPIYYHSDGGKHDWYNLDFFPVTAGTTNAIKLYVLAYSWVRPRFINSNPDPNNLDVFDLAGGDIGPVSTDVLLDDIYSVNNFFPLHGKVDTLAPWIHKTWSGTDHYGIPKGHNGYYPHEVYGKLTRNGVTRDTSIIYTVPAYDTSVVIIRY